jgi:hypothetical protein
MQFRLIYSGGLLKSASRGNTRNKEKHDIRLELHKQLQRLWETHPLLKFYNQDMHWERQGQRHYGEQHDRVGTRIQDLQNRYNGFVPIVTEFFGTYCELDILFLRAEPEGNLISGGGGDIDNRIKTLLDALQIPKPGQRGASADDAERDPRPLFVLMTDDSLISSIRITADRLLMLESDCDPADACLIVTVTVKTSNALLSPFGISF